jgi:hypothetical protein
MWLSDFSAHKEMEFDRDRFPRCKLRSLELSASPIRLYQKCTETPAVRADVEECEFGSTPILNLKPPLRRSARLDYTEINE